MSSRSERPGRPTPIFKAVRVDPAVAREADSNWGCIIVDIGVASDGRTTTYNLELESSCEVLHMLFEEAMKPFFQTWAAYTDEVDVLADLQDQEIAEHIYERIMPLISPDILLHRIDYVRQHLGNAAHDRYQRDSDEFIADFGLPDGGTLAVCITVNGYFKAFVDFAYFTPEHIMDHFFKDDPTDMGILRPH